MAGPCPRHLPIDCASFMQVVQEDNIWFRARHLPTIWILVPQEEKDMLNERSKSKSRPDRSGLESIHPSQAPRTPHRCIRLWRSPKPRMTQCFLVFQQPRDSKTATWKKNMEGCQNTQIITQRRFSALACSCLAAHR